MKTRSKSERGHPEGYDANVHIAPAPLTFLAALVLALGVPARAETPPAAIPFSDIGAKATAEYQGDALGITATSDGARLRCGFQKLEGRATPEGLWLESTDPGSAGKLRLTASALCRAGLSTLNAQPSTLPRTGTVSVVDKLVRFTRPGVTEEYSVSVDGVRQDFVIAAPPAGAGDLRVELALSGARAEAAAGGAKLRLEGSGRELAYGRLRAEDATGRELTARLEVLTTDRLAVSVSDANATYPVRIDPTFSDADWSSLGSGMNGSVLALAMSETDLYAGGVFTTAGGLPANGIAKWDGSAWSALGSGMNNGVNALAVSGTNLYAGGYFTTAGGVAVNRIAKWNGSAWSALGSGLSGNLSGNSPHVDALAVNGTNLYAGGFFTTAGGVPANAIAKWNGSAWSALGAGMDDWVRALAVSGTDIYAGGGFRTAGGVPADYIAKWDGSAWSALGSGMSSYVYALGVRGTDLYAVGPFTTAGGMAANRIAKWDGNVWSALGSGMNSPVYVLAMSGANLYAGGDFTTAGGVTANRIAKWDGSAWSALGSGMDDQVRALAVGGTNLYSGGGFSLAGTNVSPFIAQANLGNVPPAIFVPPQSQTVVLGHTTSLSVSADGSRPLIYQWLFWDTNVLTGATNSLLQLTNVQLSQSGAYSVVVTNAVGAVTSSPAMLEVITAAPTILTQPASQTRAIGTAAYFSVSVDGSLPLSYQWFFNNTSALSGATNSFLELTNLQFSQAGNYNVQVTNAFGAVTSSPAMLDLVSGVVTTCTEADLRAAMAGGGTVTFACDGTITLTSTITCAADTILDGRGRQVTISGGSAVRVFYVNTNVTFTLANLTIANGRAANGAGIFNAGGTVNLTNCTLSGNSARGSAGDDSGKNGGPGQDGCGGALDNFGVVNVIDCSFGGNSATGGGGGDGDSVYMPGDWPGSGGNGGIGFGGAVRNSGLLTASGCTFSGNSATGGSGGSGGSFNNSSTSPVNGGNGGSGGSGNGGALYNSGVAHLVNCTLGFNTGAGAAGGLGGHGSTAPTLVYAPGAPGANGATGLGFGGICDASGQCHLSNCTLARNSCTGASYGPGLYSAGGIKASGATMVNTLLAENIPGGNCLGAITDLGHNLSSDNSCAFTHAGSLNGAYLLIGPLTNNGGPTATIGLLPGCLAIDAGDNTAASPTDQRGVPRPFGLASDVGAYEYDSLNNPAPSTIVTNCTEAALRLAMSRGGTVTFACDGIVNLANTIIMPINTALDATGHQITISGNNSVRVFHVNTNVSFTAINLTIANGRSGDGAGIFNDGGVLTLLGLNLRSNAVREVLGLLPQGGAILNRGGSVNATNCNFTGNRVVRTNDSDYSPTAARGGAVRNESGEVNLHGCIFTTNRASGTVGANGGAWQPGSPGGSGWGGALDNSGTLRVSLCSFIGNSAVGCPGGAGGLSYGPSTAPNGGPGGTGAGGAIWSFGAVTINGSTFTGNSASGGTGGSGSAGGLAEPGGSGGSGGAGGSGNGGAIFTAGLAQLINSTFVFNSGAGANGAAGGTGGQARMWLRGGNGGDGGYGGSGFGAIYDSNSSCSMTNCTLAVNSGTNGSGGAAGNGGPGSIPGSPGASGSPGTAGGGIRTIGGLPFQLGGTLVNTLLATNAPGGNCFGRITDGGHNLSSDGSCAFTNIGSLNNTNPKLGSLTNNGGPTLTMALLPGSPAIDGGDDVSAPTTDQRGFPRPVGAAADIGAFEYGSPALLRIGRSSETAVEIFVLGVKTQSCRLFTSTTLSDWQCVATNQIGPNGTAHFQDNCATGETQRFYRVALP